MKNVILIQLITITLYNFNNLIYCQDHVQPAHQQIVREAWNLLKASDPQFYETFEMNYWVGTIETEGPWSFDNQGRIVAGAWREDDEDVIYGYSCPTIYWPPPIPPTRFWSTTHFWEAIDPNEIMETYNLSGYCWIPYSCDAPLTAWGRIQKYINGGWELKKQYPGNPCRSVQWSSVTYQRWDGNGTYSVTSCGPIGLMYEGLIEGPRNLYHTGYMKVTGYYDEGGEWQTFDPPLEIKLNGSQKYFCYEILGRMSHCLGDMSVPTTYTFRPTSLGATISKWFMRWRCL